MTDKELEAKLLLAADLENAWPDICDNAALAIRELVAEVRRLRGEVVVCPWTADVATTLCPEHGGPLERCPVPETTTPRQADAP